MIGEIQRVLLIPHLEVHNANALSSPFTIGFPAMTAWLGTMHALQRKINNSGLRNANFHSVAVISHRIILHTYKGTGDFISSIIGTGNPLDKDGKRSAFIEEARCHLDVSMIIHYSGVNKNEEEELIQLVTHHLNASMKIAGGDIKSFQTPLLYKIEKNNEAELWKIYRHLMPGYAIIERRELMIEAMNEGQDAMQALIEYLAIHHTCEQDNEGNIKWLSQRKILGWIVPIAIGFHGISPVGHAKNQRNPAVSHRFAESLITLGEFRMLHHITSLDEIFWQYHTDLNNNLYLCQQVKQRETHSE